MKEKRINKERNLSLFIRNGDNHFVLIDLNKLKIIMILNFMFWKVKRTTIYIKSIKNYIIKNKNYDFELYLLMYVEFCLNMKKHNIKKIL